jgi:hypothetical protein
MLYAFGADCGIAGGDHKPGNKFWNSPDVERAAWDRSGKRFHPPRVIEGEYGKCRAAGVCQEISTVHPHCLLSRWQVISVALNVERREIQSR